MPFFPTICAILPRGNFCQNLHCFVARRFSSQVYALLSVKFSDLWDIWPERWRDTKKYILTNTIWQIQFEKCILRDSWPFGQRQRQRQSQRLVAFETLITILEIEKLNSWRSLLPDNDNDRQRQRQRQRHLRHPRHQWQLQQLLTVLENFHLFDTYTDSGFWQLTIETPFDFNTKRWP